MSITLRRLTIPEFYLLVPELVDIYISAMGYSESLRSTRITAWRNDCRLPGFTSIIATEAHPNAHYVIGTAYGFAGSGRTWWHRQVAGGLRPRGQLDLLRDYFELAEIHVDPRRQARGVGRGLLTELLRNQPYARALLSTPEIPHEDNAAFRLYRSCGFTDVLRDFRFTGDARPFAILGAKLPLT